MEKLVPWADLKEEDKKKLAGLTADLKNKQNAKLMGLLQHAKNGHVLAGPYTAETRPNWRQYNINDKSDNHFIASFTDKRFADILVEQGYWTKLGGAMKRPQEKVAKNPEAVAAGAAKGFVEAKLDPLQPIQYIIISEATFDQLKYLRLGRMVYDRLLEHRDVFKVKTKDATGKEGVVEDHWKFDFQKETQLQRTVQTVDRIVDTYATALDYLIGGREGADILKGKDIELGKKDQEMKMHLLTEEALRRKITELEWDVGYWERYGRLAVSMMPPEIGGEFWRKMEIITQLEMNTKGIQAFNAQMAARLHPKEEPKKEETKSEQ